ncbi:MAG: hypothetical protein CO113_14585 [Elusimicrobia bacterium CG_4_9_14_3_um_filter_62_55]|nr:MAG: hypothetical protein CO113_14585 [Elusimicrobia bacterium CG_4_9_14_3_um_filter_62_55]
MKTLLLFAHGAGAGCASPWMRSWAKRLGEAGTVIAFDYPYMKAGKKAPDRLPKLIEAHRSELASRRKGFPRVVLIGKSMGGRVGCHLALEEKVDAIVCLGYPLRSPKGELRDEVLLALRTPVLFVQGTRDPLCPLDALKGVMKKMKAPSVLHVVESGDHSLRITAKRTKDSGETQEDADASALAAIARRTLARRESFRSRDRVGPPAAALGITSTIGAKTPSKSKPSKRRRFEKVEAIPSKLRSAEGGIATRLFYHGYNTRVNSIRNYRVFCDRIAGQWKSRPAAGLTAYACPFWLDTHVSPVFAGAAPPSARALEQLEAWFKKRKADPYFSALAGRGPELAACTKAARRSGWDLDVLETVNVWETPKPFEGRLGDEILFGDYFDPRLHRDYRSITKQVFKLDNAFMDRLARYERAVRCDVRLVVIKRGGRAIATGGVATAGASAELFGGAVLPRFRGRGLWKTLVGARQALSGFDGAKRWFMTTDNGRIAGKADDSFVWASYRPQRVLTYS